MSFAASIALAVSLALSGQTAAAAPQITVVTMPAAQTVEEYVRDYFADTPIMIEVARCESHFKQFDKDGSVHRGVVNDQDVGVMQVNEHYHLAVADKLGLDLYSIQGNLAYAKYLYEKEGTQPWSSSSPCWKKSSVYKKELALSK
ncbi:hypothetical protein A3D70_02625 [Candidatus Adlerbacteria bacterium RIFCSPHIGHO2_02_FULL_54_18]|uniref:Transglycosylase SLT domain-containing protein n=2 Tax=Candidatus Adleribacteriota TaxID=1752736 RepID=A0A1F4Y2P4_9BACT|nr:MAG: hypothetical protein A2949_02300 [Candidatus Adlerbacteria bacterium RIFCSPLOWO2_01_FULL_54_21b]OGC88222.1 MAG: hypothetical protein A3D70_02625 [Candidatus Adlerbacteria bacterium RIFCSPHIGHO2_02_FULL_54_18]